MFRPSLKYASRAARAGSTAVHQIKCGRVTYVHDSCPSRLLRVEERADAMQDDDNEGERRPTPSRAIPRISLSLDNTPHGTIDSHPIDGFDLEQTRDLASGDGIQSQTRIYARPRPMLGELVSSRECKCPLRRCVRKSQRWRMRWLIRSTVWGGFVDISSRGECVIPNGKRWNSWTSLLNKRSRYSYQPWACTHRRSGLKDTLIVSLQSCIDKVSLFDALAPFKSLIHVI